MYTRSAWPGHGWWWMRLAVVVERDCLLTGCRSKKPVLYVDLAARDDSMPMNGSGWWSQGSVAPLESCSTRCRLSWRNRQRGHVRMSRIGWFQAMFWNFNGRVASRVAWQGRCGWSV